MGRIIEWIKKNKLTAVLLLIIVVSLLRNSFFGQSYSYSPTPQYDSNIGLSQGSMKASLPFQVPPNPMTGGGSSVIPQQDRMVVKNSNLSLMVKDVVAVQKAIIDKAVELGGYMVSSNVSNPQDAASATVTVRVPANRLKDTLDYFRGLAVKVVSENLDGVDITDQYSDNEAQLAILNTTKNKFEEILDKATQVEDILTVQREIVNLQTQIDQIKGQQKYYQQDANFTKITMYLSTDELGLPYAPSESWRPAVVFKEAVRSMLLSIQKLGNLVIWLVVYTVIWVPAIVIIFIYKKRKRSSPV